MNLTDLLQKDARPVDAPPSYDDLTRENSCKSMLTSWNLFNAALVPQQPIPNAKQPVSSIATTQQYAIAGPSSTTSEPVIYNYLNPTTGELVRSFLPPDHPAMICLQTGKHISHTKFGIFGTLLPLS